jgi:hypothetical protein
MVVSRSSFGVFAGLLPPGLAFDLPQGGFKKGPMLLLNAMLQRSGIEKCDDDCQPSERKANQPIYQESELLQAALKNRLTGNQHRQGDD